MHLYWTTYHTFSVKFSPYPPSLPNISSSTLSSFPHVYPNDNNLPQQKLAIGTSQYYGIAGNGKLHILNFNNVQGLHSLRHFDTQHGIFDIAWNEMNEDQIIVGCGDGTVRLFDIKSPDNYPIRIYNEHEVEVSTVAWNGINKRLFGSGGWDNIIRIYDPEFTSSIATLKGHTKSVYGIDWHPSWGKQIGSVADDGMFILWDIHSPVPSLRFNASSVPLLCLDWAKYNEYEVSTAGTDSCIRSWDIRNIKYPLKTIQQAHKLPIRRIKYNPHEPNLLVSGSFDLSVALWNMNPIDPPNGPEINRCYHHREFVHGLDWSLYEQGLLITGSWDQSVVAWNIRKHSHPPPVPMVPKHMRMNTNPLPPSSSSVPVSTTLLQQPAPPPTSLMTTFPSQNNIVPTTLPTSTVTSNIASSITTLPTLPNSLLSSPILPPHSNI